jgi:hypothetical protein
VFQFDKDDFAGDAQLINSVYFDNENLELYHGRLDKKPNAIAVRIRWDRPGGRACAYAAGSVVRACVLARFALCRMLYAACVLRASSALSQASVGWVWGVWCVSAEVCCCVFQQSLLELST